MACSSWWNTRDNSSGIPLIHSKLSEIEKSIKELLAELKYEDGDSFEQRAQLYYQRKNEHLKKAEAFLTVYHSLTEICSQFSARSSSSTISVQQHDNANNIAKVISSEHSDSTPEFETDDPPELDMEVNGINQQKNLEKTVSSFLHRMSDAAPEDTERKINQQIVCCKGTITLTNPVEERIRSSSSEQMLQLIEENFNQMNELVKRNEEKREVIRELCGRVEKLAGVNRALQDENQRLMNEKRVLAVRLQETSTANEISKATSSLNSSSFRRKIGTSRFKTFILSTVELGNCHSKPTV